MPDTAEKIELLRKETLDALLKQAWGIRTSNFPPELNVSAPSAKTYITDRYQNVKNRFVNISVTGQACHLNCEHCKSKLLESMLPAKTPDEMVQLGRSLMGKGCQGVLISGGASADGSVPLDNYFAAISDLKDMGLEVIVHTGLVSEETVRELKAAQVDQVLIDVIGDTETIRDVYHLDKNPKHFEESLQNIKNAGLAMAPHIVIGLHFGRIVGEYNALRMISEAAPDVIVLVVLSPMHGTPMDDVTTPSAETVAQVAAIARIINPETHIAFGCARPGGKDKPALEKLLIDAGVNAMAYPTDGAMDYAESLGLKARFVERCCSLL